MAFSSRLQAVVGKPGQRLRPDLPETAPGPLGEATCLSSWTGSLLRGIHRGLPATATRVEGLTLAGLVRTFVGSEERGIQDAGKRHSLRGLVHPEHTAPPTPPIRAIPMLQVPNFAAGRMRGRPLGVVDGGPCRLSGDCQASPVSTEDPLAGRMFVVWGPVGEIP